MKKITVLGCGLVGSAMIKDLAVHHQVKAVDMNVDNLAQVSDIENVEIVNEDATDQSVFNQVVEDADLVVGALPGYLGFESVRMAILAGKNMVDISFFPEDPFELDKLAKEAGVTIVTDCGVAPGMGNIILGYHQSRMDLHSYRCLVGGLPVHRTQPWQYKAVFSPVDVIEEYTRPARYIENRHIITRPALSDPEYINFKNIGTLEAFNTDGLRSILKTGKAPNMIEKTLRFPGTIDYLYKLRESGFFSEEAIEVNGQLIRPVDFTAALVFPQWKLKRGEKEFTVMRIELEGLKENKPCKIVYDLLDYTDAKNHISSMARTTGYTGTAVANILLKSLFVRPGVNPPEFVGAEEGMLDFVLQYLALRGVMYEETYNLD